MAASTLEHLRQLHIELESLEHQLITTLIPLITLNHHHLPVHHYTPVINLARQYRTTIHQCLDVYNDKNDPLTKELETLKPSEQLWTRYYNTINTIKQAHTAAGHTDTQVNIRQLVTDAGEWDKYEHNETVDDIMSALDRVFSSNEQYGQYIDLQDAYHQFINLHAFQRYRHMDYVQFVEKLVEIVGSSSTDNTEKWNNAEYNAWLRDLNKYLYSFISRVYPLSNIEQMQQLLIDDYRNSRSGDSKQNGSAEHTDVQMTDDTLYCKACDRSFSKQTVYDAHLTGKKHIKNAQAQQSHTATTNGNTPHAQHTNIDTVEFNEFVLLQLIQLLQGHYDNTIVWLQQKRIRSTREVNADHEHLLKSIASVLQHKHSAETDNNVEDDEDTSNKPIYNPLSLPVGVDGQPIPYWLYRLHGLNQEFVCEVCGNYTYQGQKAFQQHFSEWRHIFGLKCLNIPNDKIYENITKIDELMALRKLQTETEKAQTVDASEIQEIEDSEGNVYNLKTYIELQKQGII